MQANTATATPAAPAAIAAPISKSDVMRKLADEGKTVAEIAKITQSNYSFVYSVVKRYKDEGMVTRDKSGTKSETMRVLFKEGLTVAEIAKKLNANYAFVYGVIKRYKEELEAAATGQGATQQTTVQ
jgi:transposase